MENLDKATHVLTGKMHEDRALDEEQLQGFPIYFDLVGVDDSSGRYMVLLRCKGRPGTENFLTEMKLAGAIIKTKDEVYPSKR